MGGRAGRGSAREVTARGDARARWHLGRRLHRRTHARSGRGTRRLRWQVVAARNGQSWRDSGRAQRAARGLARRAARTVDCDGRWQALLHLLLQALCLVHRPALQRAGHRAGGRRQRKRRRLAAAAEHQREGVLGHAKGRRDAGKGDERHAAASESGAGTRGCGRRRPRAGLAPGERRAVSVSSAGPPLPRARTAFCEHCTHVWSGRSRAWVGVSTQMSEGERRGKAVSGLGHPAPRGVFPPTTPPPLCSARCKTARNRISGGLPAAAMNDEHCRLPAGHNKLAPFKQYAAAAPFLPPGALTARRRLRTAPPPPPLLRERARRRARAGA